MVWFVSDGFAGRPTELEVGGDGDCRWRVMATVGGGDCSGVYRYWSPGVSWGEGAPGSTLIRGGKGEGEKEKRGR